MTEHMHDKAVLITGAASGIGRASALAFAVTGARVAGRARSKFYLGFVGSILATYDLQNADDSK